MDYFQKYLKYKAKYIMLGGVKPPIIFGLTFDELYEKTDCIYHLVHVEYSPTSENPVFGDKLEINKIKSNNKIIDFFNRKKKSLHRIQKDKTEKGFKTYYFILGYCLYIHTITLYKKQTLIDLLKTEEIQMGSPINYIVYNFDYTKNRFKKKEYSLIITLTEEDLLRFEYNNDSKNNKTVVPNFDDNYYSITMVDGIKTLNKCTILVDKYNILSCIKAKSILDRFNKYDTLFNINNKDEENILRKNPNKCNFDILNLENFNNCEIKKT
jgi:hypothetical protein